MKSATMRAAHDIYSCSAQSSITYCPVAHPGMKRLYDTITRLKRNLGEAGVDEFWCHIMRHLQRYRFTLCTAPVAINWRSNDVSTFLEDQLLRCRRMYPQFASCLDDVLNAVNELADLNDNPLLEAVESSLRTRLVEGTASSIALLLARPYLLPLAESVLSKRPQLQELQLVNQFALQGVATYDMLVIVGSVRLFPAYVFAAPRAASITVIDYAWLLDHWQRRQMLAGSVIGKGGVHEHIKDGNIPNDDHFEDVIDELLPSVDWEVIATRTARSQDEGQDQEQEEVEARLYLLAGEMAVYLESLPGTSVHVLDLDEEEGEEEEDRAPSRVHRMPIADLRPGMFLLLRTEGAGDYIVPIADRLLGYKARELRAMQENWKQRLRRAVRVDGLASTRDQLRRNGSMRANSANIRNWMSGRNIRPEDFDDFRAIMQLVGLEQEVNQCWRAAEQIDSAHRMAGFRIRDLLLKQVEHIDLARLHIDGHIDIELPGAEGGSLTAFRVEHVAPSTQLVASQLLGHPFELESDLWPV